MNEEMYAILALAARYWFCALGLLVAFRAWRITVTDNRRAKILRDWTPETGCVGEFIVYPAKGEKTARLPILREGVLGSGRRADMRVRHPDVKSRHAYIEHREGGLLIRPLKGAPVVLGDGATGEMLLMRDGDVLSIGRLRLLLVLYDASGRPDQTLLMPETIPHPPRRKRLWGERKRLR